MLDVCCGRERSEVVDVCKAEHTEDGALEGLVHFLFCEDFAPMSHEAPLDVAGVRREPTVARRRRWAVGLRVGRLGVGGDVASAPLPVGVVLPVW